MRAALALSALAVAVAAGGPRAAAATLHVSPTGSDAGACTPAAPCRSFDRAYHVARPGQAVEIAGGSYPAQTITADPRKTAPARVVLRVARGAAVSLRGDLTIDGADHLTIRGPLTVSGELFAGARSYSDDVTVAAVRAHRFDLQAVRHWLLAGGSYGDPDGIDEPGDGDNYANDKIEEYGGFVPQHVTLDGVTIHDLYCVPSNCHAEGLFLWRTRDVTIRDSTFYDDDFYDIFFAGGDDTGTVIENDWLDDPTIPASDGTRRRPTYGRGTAIQWKRGGAYGSMLVRYDSFNAGAGLSFDGADGAWVRAVGNLLRATDCGAAAYSYDVFTPGPAGAACGDHARTVAAFPYVNGGHGPRLDYRITGGVAVDLVPGTTRDERLATDRDGNRRPRGAGYDAGADELGT